MSSDDAYDEMDIAMNNDATVSAFFDDVRTAFTAAPSAEVKAAHMAARHQAPTAPAPRSRRLRRRAVRGFVVGFALVSAGGSALAATGELPAPAQRVVAHAVDHVGIHLPRVEAKRTVSAKARRRHVSPTSTVVVRTSTPSKATVTSSNGSSQTTTHVRSSTGSTTTTTTGPSSSVTTGRQRSTTDEHSSSGNSASTD